MDKDYLVTKSNYFIMNSSYDLSIEEQKIILTLASMVQPADEEFKPYKFKINEFMELLGVENKAKYTEIPKITKELMKKVFEIQEGKTILQVAWLNSARYEKGSGMVTLKFSPDLKPYMLMLKEKFTQYQLANVLSMKSKYSPRVYEILKCNEFKKQGYTEIDIETLRKLLRAEKTYPLYADFKRFILKQAQKELKKLTDISFEIEEVKTGRKVTGIKFFIHNNIHSNEKKRTSKNETAIAQAPADEIKKAEMIKQIEAVKKIFSKPINDNAAIDLLIDANGDIRAIQEKYEVVCSMKSVTNIVGAVRSAIQHNWTCQSQINERTDTFNNYDQRQYDYDDLERKLLGWDIQTDINGEPYAQEMIKNGSDESEGSVGK